jgi:acetyl-CoA carboxylase biotin carboxyl carrier protein
MGRISIDKSLIEEISQLLKENDLSEITIKQGMSSITVARNLISGEFASNTTRFLNMPKDGNNTGMHINAPVPGSVTAPMVGTLYLTPSPEAKPFIQVGSKVKEGEQLFIIEAMKTMNPVRSPFSGEVKKILVKNETPVEFGQILAVIVENKK